MIPIEIFHQYLVIGSKLPQLRTPLAIKVLQESISNNFNIQDLLISAPSTQQIEQSINIAHKLHDKYKINIKILSTQAIQKEWFKTLNAIYFILLKYNDLIEDSYYEYNKVYLQQPFEKVFIDSTLTNIISIADKYFSNVDAEDFKNSYTNNDIKLRFIYIKIMQKHLCKILPCANISKHVALGLDLYIYVQCKQQQEFFSFINQ